MNARLQQTAYIMRLNGITLDAKRIGRGSDVRIGDPMVIYECGAFAGAILPLA